MIRFYYHPSPNPLKVALFLEESGLPYEPVPVDTRKGEQHSPSYLAINPNAKTPAIVDGDVTVFDSNAILMYLAQKTGLFVPSDNGPQCAQLYSWMMFVAAGIGPYTGQCVHFKHHAPERIPYATNRYDFEARRHWGIIEARLSSRPFMLGDTYTIVDMAVWGWARAVPYVFGAEAWDTYPQVKRLFDDINSRPAAQRVDTLMKRHAFKTEMDEETLRAFFPHNARAA